MNFCDEELLTLSIVRVMSSSSLSIFWLVFFWPFVDSIVIVSSIPAPDSLESKRTITEQHQKEQGEISLDKGLQDENNLP